MTKGNEAHRRHREVHKVRLSELSGLSPQEISAMVASGDIELMVRRGDLVDDSHDDWSSRVAELFRNVAASLEGVPEHENRTIIVNIVAIGHGGGRH